MASLEIENTDQSTAPLEQDKPPKEDEGPPKVKDMLMLYGDLDKLRSTLEKYPSLAGDNFSDKLPVPLLAVFLTAFKYEAANLMLDMPALKPFLSVKLLTVAAAHCCKRNHEGAAAILPKLIEAGADVNLQLDAVHVDSTDMPDGITVLHVACIRGRPDCVRVLLDHGADMEITTSSDKNSYTPLLAAMKCATVGPRNLMGPLTRLMGATRVEMANCFSCARILLERGASPNYADGFHNTAMYYAALTGAFKMVRLLSSYGATRDLPEGNDYPDVVDALSEMDDVTIFGWLHISHDWTPLHHVDVLSLERAEKLLLEGADRNAESKSEDWESEGRIVTKTPLSIAQSILENPPALCDKEKRDVAELIVSWNEAKRQRENKQPGGKPGNSKRLKSPRC